MFSALVPLDGSESSSAVVEVAIQRAKEYDIRLVGMGIIDEPSITKKEPVPMGATYFKKERDEMLLEDASATVQNFLHEFLDACKSAGVSGSTKVVKGTPYDEICLESHRHDLIIMASESHFHFETQLAPDEVFKTIVRDSPRPMIAVPNEPSKGEKIMVGYDGSLQSARTLQMHYLLGMTKDREVEVITVHKDHAQAVFINQYAIDFYKARGVRAVSRPIDSNDSPADVILNELDPAFYRTLVMGSYGNTGLREVFFGSTSTKLLDNSPVPLFLYD